MALGKKLFEEYGKVINMNIESVHPVEGIKISTSFVSEIKGINNFPDGKNTGSGKARQYPHGISDSNHEGVLAINNNQYFWWAHDKLKLVDGKYKGVAIITGYTNSKQFLWMNNLVIVEEIIYDEVTSEFKGIGYEWI